MKLRVALLTAFLALACGKGPTMPTPLPSLIPSPTPTMQPLRVEGGRFTAAGVPVILEGAVVCCQDYPQNGWPLISESFLREIASAGGNYTHIRLGPFTEKGESAEFVAYADAGGGKVNLDEWNPDFWNRVRAVLESALQKNIYVEIDLIDSWVLERPGIHPWYRDNNVNGVDEGHCRILQTYPTELQKRWLVKIAEETGGYPNVIYQVSNESGGGNCNGLLQPEWELGVMEFLRGRALQRLIGTNSGNGTIESAADYIEIHASSAQPGRDKPVMVNEFTNFISPETFRDQIRLAKGQGTTIHAWRGDWTREEWLQALSFLKEAH